MFPQSAFRNPKFDKIIVFARGALGLPESITIEISPLEGRGSDRSFYRLRWNQKDTAILIHYNPKRIENTYYADIALFLKSINVAVPRLIQHDPTHCLVLMEDLGDVDLWSLRNSHWETRKTLYQTTLTTIHKLHTFPEEDFPSARVRLMESFGPDLYRWERNYFKDHFVKNVCGIEIEPSVEQKLEAELSGLADRLLMTKRCLIHRDLQSQNVMIRDGKPFLIDFQGMRFGSPFYDLASLLCDPYVEFDEDQRLDMLLHYYNLSHQDLGWNNFQKMFWEASAQRLMQALGAYGFLGLNKGLKAFLDHIPAGIRHLYLAVSQTASLPILQELIVECQKVNEQNR